MGSVYLVTLCTFNQVVEHQYTTDRVSSVAALIAQCYAPQPTERINTQQHGDGRVLEPDRDRFALRLPDDHRTT